MKKVLYNSKQISSELKKLYLEPKTKKIVLSAFIGKGANTYIPFDTKNLTIYCWPKAGVTNPYVIEEYLQNGVNVYFVEKLHMKLYFAEGKGCIIASANLTDNALGGSGLFEVGLYDDSFTNETLKKIIKDLPKKRVQLNSKILDDLKIQYELFQRKNPEHAEKGTVKEQLRFDQWYNAKVKKQFTFVFPVEDKSAELSDKTKEILESEYNVKYPYKFILDCNKSVYKKGTYVFSSWCDEKKGIRIKNGEWVLVDLITNKNELIEFKKLQLAKNVPPFKIDNDFLLALKETYNALRPSDSSIERGNQTFMRKLYLNYIKRLK